jgi:hypothetical protein
MILRTFVHGSAFLSLVLVPASAITSATTPTAPQASAPAQSPAKGYLGVKLTTTTEGGPVVFAAVFPKSPAEKAGLKEDDILRAVGDVEVKDVAAALEALGALRPGETTALRIERSGKVQRIQVLIAERPADLDSKAAPSAVGFEPILKVLDQDYASARKQFHTALTRRGPSPQTEAPATPPDGVERVEFRSGDLHLKAWLARPKDDTRKHPTVLFLHGGSRSDTRRTGTRAVRSATQVGS